MVDGRARAHGVVGVRDGETVTLVIKSVGDVVLPLAAISAAKLVLTPALLKATRPLDASGADEIIELPDIPPDSGFADTANDNDQDKTED